ncbi:MAG: 2-C-methyl-D-erythritol 4-phosphate cytidylyltransferase [Arenicellales bacterium]
MSSKSESIWCVIPAAGTGTRMGSARPKQYLDLSGRAVLDRTLEIFVNLSEIRGIAVGISDSDEWWSSLPLSLDDKTVAAEGGAERAQTVLNGLSKLRDFWSAGDSDWVLVHDAVRPCVKTDDIRRLITNCREFDCGGLLGCEIIDTVKRVDDEGRVIATEPRNRLRRAMTPQMFRVGELVNALEYAISRGHSSTDESVAMELMGRRPRLVHGDPLNIKITRQSDLELARMILQL